MVAAALRADDGRPARNDQRLSQGRGHRRARSRTPPGITGETGHFHGVGVHRLWSSKSGHFRGGVDGRWSGESGHQGGGVHRLAFGPAPGSRAECERVRAVSRADAEALGRGRNAMAIWQDLVGRSWLHRGVRERAPLRARIDAPDVESSGGRLGQTPWRYRSDHRTARSPAASRSCPEVRATELTNEGPHGFAVWRRRAVELTRPRSRSPEMAGFEVSTNGRFCPVHRGA